MTKKAYALVFSLLIIVSMIPLAAAQQGPEIDRIRFKVIKSPDPQLIAMQTCEIDTLTDLIRTGDIEKLKGDGFTVTSAPGFHMGFIGFNTRPDQSYKDPAHGSPIAGPVLSDPHFRHAAFHCYNQDEIVASVYKYIVTPVQSLIPPAFGGWVNTNVRLHPYNPGDPEGTTLYNPVTKANEDASSILRYAGYTYDAGENNWLTPYDLNGDTVLNDYIPELKVFTPTYEVAPTSAEHGARFCADCNAVGIPLVHDPREFAPYLDLVYGTTGVPGGEFDLYMVFYSLGRFPDHLYNFCHSSQDTRIRPGAYNGVGVNDPDLDAAVETIKFGLNHEEKLDAAHDAQAILYDPDTYPDVGCAYMLLYSRIYFNGFKPGLEGIVNSPGYGSDNGWTFLNMRWESGHANERIEDGESVVVWCLGETPERHNPLYGHTVYVWEIMGIVLDALYGVNPYTHADVYWVATDWKIEGPINETVTLDSENRLLGLSAGATVDVVDGMKCTYIIRDDVDWHCGNDYTVNDAEFNLEFFRNNEIPRYMDMWENMIDVQVINSTAFCVYNNETSQFLPYDFMGAAMYLPPPVWAPLDGRPLPEILAYDPANNLTKPTGAGPLFGTDDCPTQLYGTGPFIFDYTDPVGGYSEVHANRNFFLSTAEIGAMKTEMFHAIGDVDRNAEVWAGDRVRYSKAYGEILGDPDYDADADLNGDGIVDALDGILINFYWGDKKEYP
jgi:peptide/nickel transport system substrate-binding protein